VNHFTLIWLALVVGAAISGASVVGVLVVRRELELLTALFGMIGFGIAAFAFAEIFQEYARPDASLWALAFMVAAAGGGYALASTLLYRFGVNPAAPRLPDPLPPDIGMPAVVLVASVESESYDPRETAAMLQGLSDEGLLDASIGILPFLFFAQKARYRVVADDSPSVHEASTLAERLSDTISEAHAEVQWTASAGPGSVTSAVLAAAARGHRRIVVAELFVAEPAQMELARAEIHALGLGARGVEVRFTGALCDAERVLSMLVARVARSADSATGVVLVGHGQPEERARLHPEYDEQELLFLNRLRMLLVERGIADDFVRLAWADWGEPDITSSVRHLAALGCRRILVVPAVYPLDTVSTRLDLEVALRQARVADNILATTLPPWRDDDAVVAELHDRVAAALSESN